jgi:LemA protein
MNYKVWIGIGIVVLLVFYAVGVNNSLVSEEENVNQAWAQVENQYQRRADLIPNLVSTVRGAANFEQETLTAVIEARSQATSVNISAADLDSPERFAQFQQAQDQLSGALSRLLVTVERYPELTATQNFRDLQVQLEGTENRISTERMRFNRAAQDHNTRLRRFPASMIAGMLGFQQKAYFQAVAGSDVAPQVEF